MPRPRPTPTTPFGAWLDQWLAAHPELTMEEFGRRVGVSKSAVSLWITKSERTRIPIPRLRRIAQATGEPIGNLEVLVYGDQVDAVAADTVTVSDSASAVVTPGWAVRLDQKLDLILSRLDLLAEAEGAIRQAAQQVAEELAATQQPDDEPPPPTPIRPRGTPRG